MYYLWKEVILANQNKIILILLLQKSHQKRKRKEEFNNEEDQEMNQFQLESEIFSNEDIEVLTQLFFQEVCIFQISSRFSSLRGNANQFISLNSSIDFLNCFD